MRIDEQCLLLFAGVHGYLTDVKEIDVPEFLSGLLSFYEKMVADKEKTEVKDDISKVYYEIIDECYKTVSEGDF